MAGARVRVVDGTVWATTSASPDDVWLTSGEEHTFSRPGLTVIESVGPSTVELIPPDGDVGGHVLNRYETDAPKAACSAAAVAMAAMTIAVLVVLPAKIETRATARPAVLSGVVAATPGDIGPSRGAPDAPGRTLAQARDHAVRPVSLQ
jgi:hypothetical protein